MATSKNNKDFSNGKIYKIRCKTDNKNYIGSTVETMTKRLSRHNQRAINDAKNEFKSFKFIQKIRDLGIEQFEITLIENWPCDNVEQLKKREGYYQVINNSVNNGLNTNYESLSPFVLHLKKIQRDKEYREGPKREEILQRKRDYGQKNKEAISIKNKEYNEKNNDEIKAKKRADYQKNKEKLNIVIECPCSGTYLARGKNRHEKTQLHINYLKEKTKKENKENKVKLIKEKTEEVKNEIIETNIIEVKNSRAEVDKRYREKNKEIIKVKKAEYENKNREKIQENKKQSIFDCECGSEVRISDKARHLKTQKHQNYLSLKV